MRNAHHENRWQARQAAAAAAPVDNGIPAENLMICRPVRLTIVPDGEGILIQHHYRSPSGEARQGACLALTRAHAMALMARLSEMIQ